MSLPLASPLGLHLWASNASLKIAFENGPVGKDCQAKGMGRNSPAKIAGHIEGASIMRNTTSFDRRQTFGPQTNGRPARRTSGPVIVAPVMTEDQAAEEFSALVLPYSRGDLAQLSGRTKEAAKHWKAGSRAPNCSSLITMGRRNPRIREWVIAQMDAEVQGGREDAQADQEMRGQLQLAAQMPGQEGAMARAMLKILDRGE